MTELLLDADLEQLRAEVRDFLTVQDFTPLVDSWVRGVDLGFSAAVGAHGWIGMSWPTERGGGGHSQVARLAVTEELLRAGAPITAHWTADRQVGPSLMKYGSDELCEKFLPLIRSGQCVVGVGMSEPDAGSDLAALRTRARRVEGGWQIDGVKVWTTSAHRASHIYLLARTGGPDGRHEGLTEFLIDVDAAGLTVRPILDLNGDHHFNEVILEAVRVPDSRVIGAVGDGWKQATDTLAFERGGAERYLSCYVLLVSALEAARRGPERSAAARLGGVAARMVALRRLNLDLAAALDAGEAPSAAAATLKQLGTLIEQDVVEAAREIFAICPADAQGLDFLSQAVRAMPTSTLRGGTSEIMRTVVARAARSASQRFCFSEDLRGVVDDVLRASPGCEPDAMRTTVEALGWWRVGVPETLGGEGGDLRDVAELAAGAGRHASPVALWEPALDAWTSACSHAEVDERERREMVLVAAAIFGAVDRVCALTLQHVTTRHQFGQPLFGFQAVAHTVADMVMDRDRLFAVVNEALDRPLMATALAARVVAAQCATTTAARAHQLHGAIGVTGEHPLHHFTRQLWEWRDRGSSQRVLEERLGAIALVGEGDDALWSLITGAAPGTI